MRATAGRPEQRAHRLQSHPTSCQAACVAMALARRGAETFEVIEARLHEGAGPRGHAVTERGWTAEPGTSELKSTLDAAALAEIHEALTRGAWVMVHVFGPAWVARLPRGVSGPHGALCVAGEAARPLHSVLLVAQGPGCFFALDPFFAADQQPFEVSDAELLRVWSGFPSLVMEL